MVRLRRPKYCIGNSKVESNGMGIVPSTMCTIGEEKRPRRERHNTAWHPPPHPTPPSTNPVSKGVTIYPRYLFWGGEKLGFRRAETVGTCNSPSNLKKKNNWGSPTLAHSSHENPSQCPLHSSHRIHSSISWPKGGRGRPGSAPPYHRCTTQSICYTAHLSRRWAPTWTRCAGAS